MKREPFFWVSVSCGIVIMGLLSKRFRSILFSNQHSMKSARRKDLVDPLSQFHFTKAP
jgi:hypothetical protein